SISRRHCHIEHRGDRWVLRDLGSTNGTWVNEERIEGDMEHELCTGDRIRLGDWVILRFFDNKGAEPDRSRTLFHRGPMDRPTKPASRARILDAVDVALAAAKRDNREMSVLAIHVDQMDRIDDDESEPIEDHVLYDLARVLEGTLRDLVGRLAGNAFLMVLP